MAVASEITSVNLNPANQPARGFGGANDANLILASARAGATENTPAIDVEGGSFAEFWFKASAWSTDRTLTLKLQYSRDGGSNYRDLITAGEIINAAADVNVPYAYPVYIPKPTGTNKVTKVRLATTLGGTTGAITYDAGLKPLPDGADLAMENLAA